MLLCKRLRCRWHLVYNISPSELEAERVASFSNERETDVQNRFRRASCALCQPLRPPVRDHRPPAAGLRRNDDPKWRHSPPRYLTWLAPVDPDCKNGPEVRGLFLIGSQCRNLRGGCPPSGPVRRPATSRLLETAESILVRSLSAPAECRNTRRGKTTLALWNII